MTKRSVAQNTAFMTFASIGQKIVAFVYFTLIANKIGAEGTGQYFLALSFTTIFVVFVDLGFTNVFVREAAKRGKKLQDYLQTLLATKIALGVLSYIAMVVVMHILGYEPALRHMIYLSGVTMLFDSLHLTLYGALRAMGDLRYESASVVASQLASLVLGGTFLFLGLPIIYLILAFTIPSILNAGFAAWVLRAKHHLLLRPSFDRETFLFLGKIAIPFALAAVFARVYSYFDSIILKQFLGNESVGLYSVPYKITYAFQFVPLAVVAAFYPRFSEYGAKSSQQLSKLFEQALKYLWLVAFPIAAGIGTLAYDILVTIYDPAYLPAVPVLQVLLLGLIFSYVSFPIGALLNACGKQVSQTVIVFVTLVVNAGLNIYLIPRIGVVGAAYAALVGNIVLTIAGYMVGSSITKIRHLHLFGFVLKLLVSSAVMVLSVSLVNQSLHFTLAIAVGAVVYPVMILLTRAVTVGDIQSAVKLVKGRK